MRPKALLVALFSLSILGSGSIPAADLAIHLWSDLRPGESGELSSDPWGLQVVGGRVLWSAWNSATGREAWTWSSATEPALLLDVCPGECGGYLGALGRVGQRLVFAAQTEDSLDFGARAQSVWSTLGTQDSTARLFDGQPLAQILVPEGAESAHLPDGDLLLIEWASEGLGLWRTDGTQEGTRRFAALPDTGTYPPRILVREDARGILIFVDYWREATEIWRTDGTQNGTYRVQRMPIHRIEVSAEAPYFLAGYSEEGGPGTELWRSDGTSLGTRPLLRLSDSEGRLISTTLVQSGAVALIEASAPDGPGSTWWISDGTVAGTRRRAVEAERSVAESRAFVEHGAMIYLGSGPGGVELRALALRGGDPPAVLDTLSSLGHLEYGLVFLFPIGGLVVYPRWREETGAELVLRDLGDGTARAVDLCPGECGSAPRILAAEDQTLVVGALQPSGLEELWAVGLDGAARPVTNFESDWGGVARPPFAEGLALGSAAVLEDRVYFGASVRSFGDELWRARLDGAGLELSADLGSGPISSSPRIWGEVEGELYFVARYLEHGFPALLRTGGEPEDVTIIPEEGCHAESWFARTDRAFFWSHHVLFDGEILCVADRTSIRAFPDFEGWSLLPWNDGMLLQEWNGVWWSDGTEEGTVLLYEEESPGIEFTDERYFYSSQLGPDRWELWRSSPSGEGRAFVTELGEAGTGCDVVGAWPFDQRTLFSASLGDELSLWITDGSTAGTSRLGQFVVAYSDAGYRIGSGVEPVSFDGRALWVARVPGAESWSIWSTDGTAAGTRQVALLPLGVSSAEETPVATPLGVFFVFERTDGGRELWRSDGSAAGTYALFSAVTGIGSVPGSPVFFGDRVVFAGWDTEAGAEPWESFGTPDSTRRIVDLRPGTASSNPTGFTAFDGRIFFTAVDREHGAELWVIEPAPDESCPESEEIACTAGGRYRWFASWRDFAGNQGRARRGLEAGASALFWFFDPANLELAVRAVDGSEINGHSWVSGASLSNVEFSVTVLDARTGASSAHFNPAGSFASWNDVDALPGELRSASEPRAIVGSAAADTALESVSGSEVGCVPSASRLCVQGGRFAIEGRWRDFLGNQGTAQATPVTGDSGALWFFEDDRFELVVKVLDGQGVNGRFWVFYGALSDVEYDLTVTDTWTGRRRDYHNPLGHLASVGDIDAF